MSIPFIVVPMPKPELDELSGNLSFRVTKCIIIGSCVMLLMFLSYLTIEKMVTPLEVQIENAKTKRINDFISSVKRMGTDEAILVIKESKNIGVLMDISQDKVKDILEKSDG